MTNGLKYTALTDGAGQYWVVLGAWVHPAGKVVLCQGVLIEREQMELACMKTVPIYKRVYGGYSLIPVDRGYTLETQAGKIDYKHAVAYVHRVQPNLLIGKAAKGRGWM